MFNLDWVRYEEKAIISVLPLAHIILYKLRKRQEHSVRLFVIDNDQILQKGNKTNHFV